MSAISKEEALDIAMNNIGQVMPEHPVSAISIWNGSTAIFFAVF